MNCIDILLIDCGITEELLGSTTRGLRGYNESIGNILEVLVRTLLRDDDKCSTVSWRLLYRKLLMGWARVVDVD